MASSSPPPPAQPTAANGSRSRHPAPRPVIFLDIDGVLNTTKHNTQIHFERHLLQRLKSIVVATDAVIVLTTFWRHFHEYISYVLHRHGIDVSRHVLPLPMGATAGKQCTKNFARHHRLVRQQNDEEDGFAGSGEAANGISGAMMGRSADDEGEYASRADEIEAWLERYGEEYLGGGGDDGGIGNSRCSTNDNKCDEIICPSGEEGGSEGSSYGYHSVGWRYVILDDRAIAAKPGTPLHDRFVHTDTKIGLTEEDAERAIRLLTTGP